MLSLCVGPSTALVTSVKATSYAFVGAFLSGFSHGQKLNNDLPIKATYSNQGPNCPR
ncbi:MAG: hypothetical protein IPQ04_03015 [Saprospiraceae bacterium]|nr:hypothetical protein [Saprospiraceae bacterium]